MSFFEYIPLIFAPGRLKRHLKASLRRALSARPWQYALWWAIRVVVLYVMIRNILDPEYDNFADTLQLILVTAVSFTWELLQFLPGNHILRWLGPSIQVVSIPFSIICVAGNMFGAYEGFPMWDSIVHFISGVLVVVAGYELAAAYEKRDKVIIPRSATLLLAMGLSFFISAFWEVWEFLFDQFTNGNTQDWVYYEGRNFIFGILPREIEAGNHERFALLDSMTDIIMHTAGTFVTVAVLRFFPYRHKKGTWDANGSPAK